MCRLIRAANRDRGDAILLIDPIFIVGVPRSGTTLLQSLLSAHSGAYSLPETHFFSTVLPRLGKSAQEPMGAESLSDALALVRELMDLQLSGAQRARLNALIGQEALTGRYLFEFILDSYRPAGGDRLRVVEKTPLHLEHMPEISAIYPDARFVHIVRDPRNTISSLLETDFAPTRWLLWYTQYWNYALALADRFAEQHADAILTARYEVLVEDPPGAMSSICEFVGMEYEDRMISDFASEQERNVLGDREPWKMQKQDGQIHADADVWKQRLRPCEGWLIEWFTRGKMAELGYQPAADPTWRDKAAVLWQSFRQPHRDQRAAKMGHYLIGRCREQGLAGHARLLSACMAVNDVGELRNSRLGRALFGNADRR